MLVCQDCGSHRIAETGGTELVASCPKCGLPVREGDVGVTTTEADGMAHTTCPEPGTPLRPDTTVPVAADVPTKAAYDLAANQEHVSALGQLGQTDAGKQVLAEVPTPDVVPIPADAPALQDPASAALLAAGAPVGPPAGTPVDVAPSTIGAMSEPAPGPGTTPGDVPGGPSNANADNNPPGPLGHNPDAEAADRDALDADDEKIAEDEAKLKADTEKPKLP